MTNKKSFIFLYPIPEYFDDEIKNGSYSFKFGNEQRTAINNLLEKIKSDRIADAISEAYSAKMERIFRELYTEKLNACIDLRYRQNGFAINYAIFDRHPISDVIRLHPDDRIIEVGMDFKTHGTEINGKHPYPDDDHILNQLGDVKVLRAAGFHVSDCVGKLAKRAYERGLDTLVDEDLTQFFRHYMQLEGFNLGEYDPRLTLEHEFKLSPDADNSEYLKDVIKAREGKPWLWQDYFDM